MEAERIQYKQRVSFFEQLQEDRTLIRMRLLGKQFESLTLVTGIRNQRNARFLFVDYPQGFKEAVADGEECHIYFEFNGKDNLKYVFRTTGHKIINNEICIRFPEFIERRQRRKNFRIKPPLGTKLFINESSARHEVNVLNVSPRGVLGVPVISDNGHENHKMAQVGDSLKNLELVFPFRAQDLIIRIREAVMIRYEESPALNRNVCALQFLDIEKSQAKRLIEFIFRYQRDLLRKRRLNDG